MFWFRCAWRHHIERRCSGRDLEDRAQHPATLHLQAGHPAVRALALCNVTQTDNIRIRGIFVGSKQQFEELLRFAEFNEIHPHIDRVFAFEEAVEALQYLESAQHFGKIVIRVTPH